MEILYQCPLCASHKIKPHSVRYRQSYPHCTRSKCSSCDLVFANPMASKEELTAFYQNYYDAGNFSLDNWKERTANFFNKSAHLSPKEFMTQHKRSLKYYQLGTGKNKRFLDIGCGLGKDVFVAKQCGWEVYATEYDGDAIEFIKQYVPEASLYQGDFIEAKYPDNYFDYVLLYHVIEHVSDPQMVVKELQRIIKPGGILFIGTPNIGNIGYRMYRFTQLIQGKIPGIVDGMEHTFLFTKKRLADLLIKTGFEIKLHKSEAHTEGFWSIIRSSDGIKRKITRVVQLVFGVNQKVLCIKK